MFLRKQIPTAGRTVQVLCGFSWEHTFEASVAASSRTPRGCDRTRENFSELRYVHVTLASYVDGSNTI